MRAANIAGTLDRGSRDFADHVILTTATGNFASGIDALVRVAAQVTTLIRKEATV